MRYRGRRRIRGAALLAPVLLCAACAGCAWWESGPQELTVTEAGGAYLDAVCPANEAWGRADVAVDRLRIEVRRDGDGDTGELADAMGRLADASDEGARRLGPEVYSWPSGSAAAVERVRATLERDAEQAREVAELDAERAASYAWDSDDTAEAAAAAREALGLPDDSGTACAERSAGGEAD